MLPFHIYNLSLVNVAKFTFGLLQDGSKLADVLCARFFDDIKCFLHDSEKNFFRIRGKVGTERIWKEQRLRWKKHILKNLIMYITTENVSSPFIQVRNGNILCKAKKLSNHPGLVYIRGRFEQLEIEIDQSKSVDTTTEGKSDIIFLDNVSRNDLLKVLQKCDRPVQGFYFHLHCDPEERCPIPVLVTSPVQFTDNAGVEIHRTDFRETTYKSIVEGMEKCKTLEKIVLYHCQSLPKELLFSIGQMRNLGVLVVNHCHLSDDCCEILCDQVKHLDSLQILSLADSLSPLVDIVPLLNSLVKCPLAILELNGLNLTGNINKAWNVPGTYFIHLRKLFLDRTGLNEDDLLTIKNLISEKKMPKLQELFLLSIGFKELLLPLSELLLSCDEQLEDCTVWATSCHLPEPFNHDRFKCLCSPQSGVSYDYGFQYQYYDGKEIEVDFEYDYAYDYLVV